MAALTNQKPFTFMKDATVFEDPKPISRGQVLMQLEKAWVPTLRKAGIRYRNPYQTRPHSPPTYQPGTTFQLAAQIKKARDAFRHYGRYLKEYDNNTSLNN